MELAIDDPRRVSTVLAPTKPPPTADTVAQKKSRFAVNDQDKTVDYSCTDKSSFLARPVY